MVVFRRLFFGWLSLLLNLLLKLLLSFFFIRFLFFCCWVVVMDCRILKVLLVGMLLNNLGFMVCIV